jgi:hypothetical protein
VRGLRIDGSHPLLHTREEAEVAFVAMKTGLEEVLARGDDCRFRDFVERFP